MNHLLFDILASLSSATLTFIVYRWRLADAAAKVDSAGVGYGLALVLGAILGGYGFGTLNLWLSDIDQIGRSILGALVGAIAAIEAFKRASNISGSTGLLFVPAFTTSLVIGRLGCFAEGLEDQTHGIATQSLFAVDFGDGVPRHPVQLYESVGMFVFLALTLLALQRRSSLFMQHGFYLMCIWYGAQRFLWEFLKPYKTLVGSFNLFHILCTVLIFYGLCMILIARKRT
ncbi:MAG: diacylglyceryl transferase [Rhodobacteraceae bacterium]|nr:diacylglyceryl transferase [Paracoccaceae bacterium]